MGSKTQPTHIEKAASGATMTSLKILKATIEDEKPCGANTYVFCACGSGGGCGGYGVRRRTTSM